MPAGTNAIRSAAVPVPNAVENFQAFRERTMRHEYAPITREDAGPGNTFVAALPQHGIQTKLRITFDGTVTFTPGAGSITPGDRWPYGFLAQLGLKVNGHDRFNLSGVDLKVLEYVRYAAFEPVSDAFPGAIGDTTALTGADDGDFHLTWELPIATDDYTFAGAMFAQASSFNAQLTIQQVDESTDDAFLALAGGATVTFDGTWYVHPVTFDVPQDAEGRLIIPEGVRRIHGIHAFEDIFTGTGSKRVELVNTDAQLLRLLVSARNTDTNRLLFAADAAAAEKVNRLQFSHGASETPLTYDPAATLVGINNRHYGGLVPYDRAVLDFMKEDAIRDAVYMQGLTELAVLLDVNSAVAVTAGKVRLVQETLI